MTDTDEMVKVEIVLQRNGTLALKVWSTGVVGEARPTLIYGLLQRAILELHAKHKEGTKP